MPYKLVDRTKPINRKVPCQNSIRLAIHTSALGASPMFASPHHTEWEEKKETEKKKWNIRCPKSQLTLLQVKEDTKIYTHFEHSKIEWIHCMANQGFFLFYFFFIELLIDYCSNSPILRHIDPIQLEIPGGNCRASAAFVPYILQCILEYYRRP